MSLEGQTRSFGDVDPMSGLPESGQNRARPNLPTPTVMLTSFDCRRVMTAHPTAPCLLGVSQVQRVQLCEVYRRDAHSARGPRERHAIGRCDGDKSSQAA
jgi:hypothetical protein